MILQSHYVTTLVFTTIVNFCLGIFVYVKGRNKLPNQIYTLFCLCIAIWTYGQMKMMTADNRYIALHWARFMLTGVLFIAPLYAHFIFSLINDSRRKRKFLIVSYVINCTLIPILYLTKSLISGISFKFSHSYFVKPGILFSIFLTIWLIIVAYTQMELYKAYRLAKGERKNQFKYVFWGLLVGYIGGCGNYLLVYDIELFPYTPFGTYAVTFHNILIAYAILYHKLFDITIVIRKTLIYSALVTFVTVIYLTSVIVIEKIFQGTVGYSSLSITILASFFIALCFIPLKNKIQFFIDRYFFKKTTKELAEENLKLHQELLHHDRMKDAVTLAAGMAHEIRNPLTIIKTFTEFLPEKHNDKTFVENFARLVKPEVEKVSFSVQQLLDFSKPTAPKLEPVKIFTLIQDTLGLLSSDFLKHRIMSSLYFSDNDIIVAADKNQLKQIFLNLFLNSIDAMPQGGSLNVSGRLVQNNGRMPFKNNDEKLEISVQDSGCGISEEDLGRVFQPFFTTKPTGTGLGLSVVRDIIEQHKAAIRVECEADEGARFIIRFPIAEVTKSV